MADQEHHMIRYWINKKGIEEAFRTYYPDLARRDPVIHQALTMRELAEKALMARVDELEAEAPGPQDEPCSGCGSWCCNGECSGDGQMGD